MPNCDGMILSNLTNEVELLACVWMRQRKNCLIIPVARDRVRIDNT